MMPEKVSPGRLSIGVSIGSQISVGGHIVYVKAVSSPNLLVITVDDGKDILITDEEKKEILPQVFVQSGIGRSGGGNRLLFEADKLIRISRIESRHAVE